MLGHSIKEKIMEKPYILWQMHEYPAPRTYPYPSRKRCIHAEKELREHLTERQIDKMIADSFPASDPPSTY